MSKRDYYEILGVGKSADEAELKSAFRKAAMKHHPDRNPGDKAAEAKFKELNEAYDTLKDPQKRAAYDRYGHAAFENGGMGPGGPGFSGDFAQTMSDIFESFFGGDGGPRRGAGGRERGADLRYNLDITLEEAFAGKQVEINVPTSIACEVCTGTGAKPGTSPPDLPHLRRRRPGCARRRASSPSSGRVRPAAGRGQVIADPCTKCGGTGRTVRGQDADRVGSGRHRGRHPHPARRRG